MESVKRYYCHCCKNEFDSTIDEENIKWNFWRSQFWEQVEAQSQVNNSNNGSSSNINDHPSSFQPYSIPEPEVVTQTQSNEYTSTFQMENLISESVNGRQPRVIRIENNFGTIDLSNLLSGLLGNQLASQIADQSMESILQQVMDNDPNKYGPPPASQKVIESLPKGSYKELTEDIECIDLEVVDSSNGKLFIIKIKIKSNYIATDTKLKQKEKQSSLV